MNKWKWAFFMSTALSIVVIAFLLYAVIDQSVTITYMSQGYRDTEKDLERLAAAFPKDVYSKKRCGICAKARQSRGLHCRKQMHGSIKGASF